MANSVGIGLSEGADILGFEIRVRPIVRKESSRADAACPE